MKIVQSCWACNREHLFRFNAGWRGPEYNLMSWALSSLQLNKFYSNLVLYADSASARTLIDELQLPYNSICCELDKLNTYDTRLWALPKIYAYSKQEEPFLHVDADVFIWKPFDKQLLSGDLIAQNVEVVNEYYEAIMRSLQENLKYFPSEILNEQSANAKFYAYNAGILGGKDLTFFKEYTAKAFEFVLRNTGYFDKIKVGDFNVFFEQYLFYCLVKKQNKKVEVLLPEILDRYIGFGEFHEVPHNRQFLHLLGQYKANKSCYEQMADRLRLDYPEYYYRIIALFRNRQLPLKKTYYTLFDNHTEHDLIKHYCNLMSDYKEDKLCITSRDNIARIFEPNGFRVGLVRSAIDMKIAKSDDIDRNYQVHLQDVEIFENKVDDILNRTFSYYSPEYLYARDITFTQYFKIIFGDKVLGYNRSIVTDPLYKIVESLYDWSEINLGDYGQTVLLEQLDLLPSKNLIAIIPECDSIGYHLLNIDELDLAILDICQTPSSINDIFKVLASYFDQADLEESQGEFEELIMGRIKVTLANKMMKVAQFDE